MEYTKGLTLGRVVHFVTKFGEHRAATVARVLDKEQGIVTLCVLNDVDKRIDWETNVRPDMRPGDSWEGNSWHWPERAD